MMPTAERDLMAPPQQLAQLVGASRARVLAALKQPRTTAELAADLELAASTVSAHLSALAEAGLLERQRSGRAVYYCLSNRGRKLVALMSDRR
jgi:DNA-binding transcriptional ArsR family regulator